VNNAILLLEDDEISRHLLLKIIYTTLSSADYNVYIAENGNEALAIIQNHGDNIVLFATDIVHPGMDITKLIQTAKAMNTNMSIALISGSDNIKEDYGELADFVLIKPFMLEDFAKILREKFKRG
jgi:two-component system cell cycle sensor histidine kinase/response regulator CckA